VSWNGTSWNDNEPAPPANSIGYGMASAVVYNENIYFMGNSMTNVFKFDGTTWTEVAGILGSRYAGTAVAYSNKIYYICGNQYGSGAKNNVYVYDGTNWSNGTSYPLAINSHTAFVDDEMIWVCGGEDGFGDKGKTNVYAWNGSSWIQKPALSTGKSRAKAEILGGKVFMLSGNITAGFGNTTNSIYMDY